MALAKYVVNEIIEAYADLRKQERVLQHNISTLKTTLSETIGERNTAFLEITTESESPVARRMFGIVKSVALESVSDLNDSKERLEKAVINARACGLSVSQVVDAMNEVCLGKSVTKVYDNLSK